MDWIFHLIVGVCLVVILMSPMDISSLDIFSKTGARGGEDATESTFQLMLEGYAVLRRSKEEMATWVGTYYKRQGRNQIFEQGALQGRNVIITGATKGLGSGIVAHFALLGGAKLILPVRSKVSLDEIKEQIAATAEEIKESYGNSDTKDFHKNPDILLLPLDLADMDSIDQFVAELEKRNLKIHILINNAGLVSNDASARTKQGFEVAFGVNFVGSAYLSDQLIKKNLMAPYSENGRTMLPRIVSVTSEEYRSCATWPEIEKQNNIQFGGPWGVGIIDAMVRYQASKLALVTYDLAIPRKYANVAKVKSFDICPGPVQSDIARDSPWIINEIVKLFMKLLFQSPSLAAIPIIRLALDEQLENAAAEHYHMWEKRIPRKAANDEKEQDRIFEATQKLFAARKPPSSV